MDKIKYEIEFWDRFSQDFEEEGRGVKVKKNGNLTLSNFDLYKKEHWGKVLEDSITILNSEEEINNITTEYGVIPNWFGGAIVMKQGEVLVDEDLSVVDSEFWERLHPDKKVEVTIQYKEEI